MSPLTPDNANRLAVGLARSLGIHYFEAEAILKSLTLRLVLTLEGCATPAGQAAFLTALNSGSRAFLGGVEVQMPANVPLLLPLRGYQTLNETIAATGCTPGPVPAPAKTIYFGSPDTSARADDVCVHCDSWRAGISNADTPAIFVQGDGDNFSLGGIMAGAMAVHRCFIRATRLPARGLEQPLGISLWEPGADWLQPVTGVKLRALPNSLWLLGLGHLGQAYLWSLALLPFKDPAAVLFLLQDFDVIASANHGSGLLATADSVGHKKVRHCAGWLERHGFKTAITERKFQGPDFRQTGEPYIAMCGFDRATPRAYLEKAGFNLIFECGLGGTLADFDQAEFHIFPSARHTAAGLWGQTEAPAEPVADVTAKLFETNPQAACGALAIDIAGKSVSTSFVGAMAGALLVAELLRTYNQGRRLDRVSFDARVGEPWEFHPAAKNLTASELAILGYTHVTQLPR